MMLELFIISEPTIPIHCILFCFTDGTNNKFQMCNNGRYYIYVLYFEPRNVGFYKSGCHEREAKY